MGEFYFNRDYDFIVARSEIAAVATNPKMPNEVEIVCTSGSTLRIKCGFVSRAIDLVAEIAEWLAHDDS